MLCNWLQIYYKTLLKPIIYEKKVPVRRWKDEKMERWKNGKYDCGSSSYFHFSIF